MTKHYGHEIKVLQFIQLKHTFSDFTDCIKDFKPHVIGFTSVVTQFPIIKRLAVLAKAISPGTITVCGGVHPTIFPNCLLETDSLDGIFIGESEFAFADFLNKIENKELFTDADNFAYKKNGAIVKNDLKPQIPHLDSLPYPDRKSFSSTVDFIEKSNKALLSFSRGCPYRCTYCSNAALAQVYDRKTNRIRFRSVESSIREIEQTLMEFPNIEAFEFKDEIFGFERSWLREFVNEYSARIGLPFDCSSRINVIDEEYVSLLKSAGCTLVHIGVESGNEQIRNGVMGRNMSNTHIINTFNLLHKYGISTSTNIILGVPGETEETIWDTIALCRKIRPSKYNVFIYYPFPGTELGDYCYANNLVDTEKASELFENPELYDEGILGASILKFPDYFAKKLYDFSKNLNLYIDSDRNKRPRIRERIITINIDKMSSFGTCGYQAVIPVDKELCDSSQNPINTFYRLFENETELIPAHALHEHIGLKGRGRHSLWLSTLYFSTSDNSDPRNNGRIYTLRYDDIPLNFQREYSHRSLRTMKNAVKGFFHKSFR